MPCDAMLGEVMRKMLMLLFLGGLLAGCAGGSASPDLQAALDDKLTRDRPTGP